MARRERPGRNGQGEMAVDLTVIRVVDKVGFHHPAVQGLGPAVNVADDLVVVVH